MSRDFILVFSGGVISLVTTLAVLFIADFFYRRGATKKLTQEATRVVEAARNRRLNRNAKAGRRECS